MATVTMVRVYLTEQEDLLKTLMQRLKEEGVSGTTVFRGISGFGESGKLHTSMLIDLALDLPLVVELFDTPDKIDTILSHLTDLVEARHVVSWTAQLQTAG